MNDSEACITTRLGLSNLQVHSRTYKLFAGEAVPNKLQAEVLNKLEESATFGKASWRLQGGITKHADTAGLCLNPELSE